MGDRAYKLRKRYSITESVYQSIIKGQDYKCAICGDDHSEDKKLHIEHYEGEGGKWIRGASCGLCNSMLAFAREDPAILQSAIEYLKRR